MSTAIILQTLFLSFFLTFFLSFSLYLNNLVCPKKSYSLNHPLHSKSFPLKPPENASQKNFPLKHPKFSLTSKIYLHSANISSPFPQLLLPSLPPSFRFSSPPSFPISLPLPSSLPPSLSLPPSESILEPGIQRDRKLVHLMA